ncbi:MAG: type II toxin-antitoxin system prevent-host-death family antitoxin, partial [Candidatus Humimicrobiaceae bacterium]
MIVNSTDLKNNLGKYLRECMKEDVVITSNGRKTAKLCAYLKEGEKKPKINYVDRIGEGSEAFNYDSPKKVPYEEFLKLTENSDQRYE